MQNVPARSQTLATGRPQRPHNPTAASPLARARHGSWPRLLGCNKTIDLLPDTIHDLQVSGRVRQTTGGGCTFGGYVLSTTQDRNGDPLRIDQRFYRIFVPFLMKDETP